MLMITQLSCSGIPSGPGGGTTTWGVADDFTLSNGNLTATHAVAGWESVSTNQSFAGADYSYVEILVDHAAGGFYVGVASRTLTGASSVGYDNGGWGIAASTGDLYHGNGVVASTALTFATGDTMRLCVRAGGFYVGKNGVWASGCDPAAGTGALVAGLPAILWLVCSTPSLDTVTLRVAPSSWLYAAPAGASPLP